ncbi:MAG: Cys-tRNA(Pro) deacylase [Deltaproteobacteria bacterium]|nr:Cys-tRNA(Pro) deacylase [Deltaproteobacteria bacterium]
MKRTKAIEILDAKKVSYELREFEAVELTTNEVAAKLGIPIEWVYKTLVVAGQSGKMMMAIVRGDMELNLKAFAKVLGEKKCDLIPQGDLQRVTGYLKGGCSPLGSKKVLPVYIDNTAKDVVRISVSAGLRGLQMLVNAEDLAKVVNASFFDLQC